MIQRKHKFLGLLGRLIALIGVLALLVSPAFAHPGKRPHKHPHGAQKVKKVKERWKDATPEQRQEWRQKHRKWVKNHKAGRATWRKARTARVKALKRRLHRQLKGRPITKAVTAELRVHNRRMARLNRLKVVATEKEDDDAVARIDELIGKEQTRHQGWFNALKPEEQ